VEEQWRGSVLEVRSGLELLLEFGENMRLRHNFRGWGTYLPFTHTEADQQILSNHSSADKSNELPIDVCSSKDTTQSA